MQASEEREAFSRQLRIALDNAGWKGMGPAMLAREYSRRGQGGVTVHAARKWLMGESIPTQGRLRVLADWLGVSSEWLRFGAPAPLPGQACQEAVGVADAPEMHALLVDIERLDAVQLRVVRELVGLLLRR